MVAESERAWGERRRLVVPRSGANGPKRVRRRTRRSRYESLFEFIRKTPTPEELLAARQEQQRVDVVLSVIDRRHAELLLLRSHGLTYDELASTMELNPASIGTLLSRAQQAFRKEYIKRYERGRHENG